MDPNGENVGQFIEGFIRGEWEAAKSKIEGLKDLVTDPLGTISQVAHAVAHPIETGTAVVNAVADSWSSGDAGKGRVVGRVAGELTLAAIGTKTATSLVKSGTATQAAVTANRAAGKAGEARAAAVLSAEGETIVASQVAVKTSAGLRVIDHLLDTPSGLVNVEVKTGTGRRTAAQIMKDNLMASEGGIILGKNAPEGYQGMQIIKTVVRKF